MSFFTLRALLFVAECAAASVLLPLLAFAATRLLRRAALRHLAWLTMFGVLAVLPAAALLLPARQIVLPIAAPVVAPVEIPAEMMAAPVLPSVANLPVPAVTAAPVTSTPALRASKPLLTVENALLLLVLLWAAGLLWHLGRMVLGGIGLMRLRRQSEVFGIANAPCQLLVSPQVSGPSTFGLFRPVILLPEGARGWNPARLAAVLAHEAAHVQRRDTLNQFVVRLVCALYWLNPLLWLAARALRREAELAADDAALASGLTPSAYAAELVALAAEARRPAPGVAMADSALAARVQAALAANISRKGVNRMDIARMASLGLAATLLLGTARLDLALAQEAPVNPVPAAKPAPAAPPARNVAPKVDIDIKRNVQRNIDVEVEAIKARADATAAEARARAAAEPDAVKRAQYAQEAARVAAEAARTKLRADETRQRAAQVAQNALETQQRTLGVQQKALEAQQRALEAEARSQAARANADALRRRLDKESRLTPLSDTEVLTAARQQKLTVSPVEVDERLRVAANQSLSVPVDVLRQRAVADIAREKLARLQSETASRTGAVLDQAKKPEAFMVSLVDGKPVGNYLVRRRFSGDDMSINLAVITPFLGSISPELLAKLDSAIETAVNQAIEAIEAGEAAAPRGSRANEVQFGGYWRGNDVTVDFGVTGQQRGNVAVLDRVIEANKKIDAAFAEAKAASSVR